METSGVLWLQTHGHPPEEVLERYSMASAARGLNHSAAALSKGLTEEEHERVEEHLLLCESCRRQLDECDRWVALMKAAAIPDPHGSISPPVWQRWWQSVSGFASWPALAGGMAMFVAVLWIAPAMMAPRTSSEAQPVSLSALRGNDLRVRVRAGSVLELKIEDNDVADASVSIVRSNGDAVWSGKLSGNTVQAGPLRKGLYWVRLMSPGSGEQLKEYGLLVE